MRHMCIMFTHSRKLNVCADREHDHARIIIVGTVYVHACGGTLRRNVIHDVHYSIHVIDEHCVDSCGYAIVRFLRDGCTLKRSLQSKRIRESRQRFSAAQFTNLHKHNHNLYSLNASAHSDMRMVIMRTALKQRAYVTINVCQFDTAHQKYAGTRAQSTKRVRCVHTSNLQQVAFYDVYTPSSDNNQQRPQSSYHCASTDCELDSSLLLRTTITYNVIVSVYTSYRMFSCIRFTIIPYKLSLCIRL